MKLKERVWRELSYASLIPKGWGIAYNNWNRDTAIICPIPFNIVIGSLRYIYYRLVTGIYPTYIDKLIERGILIEKENKVNMAADLFEKEFPNKLYKTIFKAQFDANSKFFEVADKNAKELAIIELLVGAPTANAVSIALTQWIEKTKVLEARLNEKEKEEKEN